MEERRLLEDTWDVFVARLFSPARYSICVTLLVHLYPRVCMPPRFRWAAAPCAWST